MKRITSIALFLVFTVVTGVQAQWVEEAKLTALDGALSDYFGYSVCIDGDYAIVGVYGDDFVGSAYIFERIGGSWSQVAKLTPSDGVSGDNFGWSVSISGDYVIVGAPYADPTYTSAGAAYIFEKPVGGWVDMTQTAKLTASDAYTSDYFGRSVSISGDYVIVGAPYEDPTYTNAGAAYIFEKPVGGWVDMTETKKLIASDRYTYDYFGHSVSISGNYAIVGAYGDDYAGSAYIFERNGGSWNQVKKLLPSDGVSGDNFGYSVCISGDYAIVGAYYGDGKVTNSGSAYIFKRDGTSWSQQAKLTASDGAASDYFGWSVCISADNAIVGAHYCDDNGSSSGAIYRFEKPESGWVNMTETEKLLPSDGATYDYFGYSVSVSGDHCLGGAYGDESYTGSAYVFGIPDPLVVTPEEDFLSSGNQGGPFDPCCMTYTLMNIGDTALDWRTAEAPCSWVTIDPNGGTLLPGELNSVDVNVCINEQADTLQRGLHTCEVTFTNTDTDYSQFRNVELCVGPTKILAYTQYVNPIEYENILAALDDYLGECYTLDELTSYADLDSNLPGHDVFLIPEPEGAVQATLEVIGFLWKDKLQEFVNNGGIVVHCDGSDKYGILTGAELMDISLGGSCSGYSVNVVAPDDPVADGVSSPYTAQSYSRYYTTSEETVVVERTGYGAVVIHKQFGQGHVIMIGHDYYYTNPDQDLIVGNAVFNIDNMVVEPAEGFSSVGNEEGPFTPWQKSYTVYNNGAEEIQWEASITCDTPENWLTVEPNSGTLSPDGNEPVVVSLTDDANDLWPGTYDCNVVFLNLDSGKGQIRNVSLDVNNVLGQLEVTDSVDDACDLNMPFGNVIVGLTRTEQVTITNIDLNQRHEVTIESIYLDGGYDAFNLTLPPNGPPWTLYDGNSLVVDVNFVPIEITDYDSDLVIVSDDPNNPIVRIVVSGTGILDYLQIIPDANSEFSGHVGGPFMPWNASYELYNDGPNDIDWSAEPNVPWLSVEPNSGTLPPDANTTVTVTPNAQAENLLGGYYCGDVNFTNITTTVHQKRGVCLDVYSEPKIWTSPQYFDVTLAYGETETRTLTIGNSGSSPFSFALSSCQPSFTPPPKQSVAGTSRAVVSAPDGHDFTVAADVPFAPGELLVRFAPREDRSWPDIVEKNAILSSLGSASIEREYRIVLGLCLVKLPAGVTVEQALVSFNNTAGILYAEPNYKLKLLSTIPNDTYFDDLWGMHNTGQTGGAEDADIDAPEAWDISTDAGDIIVAVIDSGIDYDHEDLAANMWVNSGEIPDNGQDDDGNGYVDDIRGWDFYAEDNDPMDYHGHGTHVAGTIGAVGNNSKGVIGVCWNVKLMALQITHYDQETWSVWVSNAIQAIEYGVANDAKIMSNSWGGTTHIQSLEDVIEDAGEAGVLFVAAAGNDYGNNNDTYPRYPSSYDSENIIAVMSTDHYDNMSSFSNYGPTSVDLGAPGTSILSCEPGNQYQYLSGTSMATPCVAGACALVWSACPSLSYLEVKNIILDTVDPLPVLDGLCVTGGRLNLYDALLKAEDSCALPWLAFEPDAGTVLPACVNDVNVIFDANRPPGTYEGYITITISSEDVCDVNIPVRMTVEPSDYFTELFEADYFDPNDPNCNDMANRTLIFVPDGSSNYYSACSSEATYFPVDPNGGTVVSLGDDDYEPVTLQYPDVNFYGTNYDTFFISSNGYITFESPDITYAESLVDHFALPRISPLFDDLNPSAGGTISWKQLSDRIAVTFENVPEYSLSNSNSFQVELFFNGMIRITWLNIDSQDGLVGLSEGMELPADFVESDLSEYRFSCDLDGDCDVDFSDYAVFGSYWFEDCNPQNNWCEGADFEPDGVVDVMDLQKFALQWLAGK